MHDTVPVKSHYPHHQQRRREPTLYGHRSWCCSFVVPPLSPDNPANAATKTHPPLNNTQRLPLSRRILSPGRVSPISENPFPETPKNRTRSIPTSPKLPTSGDPTRSPEQSGRREFDVRLNVKGRKGGSLVFELSSDVLVANSAVFAGLIEGYRRNQSGLCRIEVPDVENLSIFREAIELMFEKDIEKRLVKIGVFRVIDILEISESIKFSRSVTACLRYLEAVPWTEEEEEKLRTLFTKLKLDDATVKQILARLLGLDSADSQQTLANKLIWSVTTGIDANARAELKSMVKGLLSKSSVYEKNCPDLNKEDIYAVCQSCLSSLVNLFNEASGADPCQKLHKAEKDKPLLERISKQVDSINWLLEILLDHQMAEEFVHMWADQVDLINMHESASPMVRYELSRVSAILFIAMGTRKVHCRVEARSWFVQVWFRPLLSDFGWLRRCRNGLDIKGLEESMGQVLLTLPLNEQYPLFMDWFQNFSKHGNECPNLSKAFQIWWRRSFLRGSETLAAEFR